MVVVVVVVVVVDVVGLPGLTGDRLGGHQILTVDDDGRLLGVVFSGMVTLDSVVGLTLGGVLGRGHHVFSVDGVGTVAGVDGVGGGVATTPGPPMANTWLMVLSMGNFMP